MSDFVVDSSVVAKWILAEADSAQARRLMRDTVSRGSKLIVIDLVFPEVANVIWKRARQNLITQAEATRILEALTRLPVSIEPAFPLLGKALDIAVKFDRAVYDSLFVALTSELSVSGVTADERLYNGIHRDFPSIQLLRDY